MIITRIERDGWVSTDPVVDPALLDAVIADVPTWPEAAGRATYACTEFAAEAQPHGLAWHGQW